MDARGYGGAGAGHLLPRHRTWTIQCDLPDLHRRLVVLGAGGPAGLCDAVRRIGTRVCTAAGARAPLCAAAGQPAAAPGDVPRGGADRLCRTMRDLAAARA